MIGVIVEGVELRISGHMEMIRRNSRGVNFLEVSKSMMDLMFELGGGGGVWCDDMEGISGVLRGLRGREMVFVLKEREGKWRKWGGFVAGVVGEEMEECVLHRVGLHYMADCEGW
ncbi:hypothetical protein H0E87_012151 [Populus deltoides]|uniref:Uncharacterized protein n=1 Tax=Populus deltoides TaxID=3696 RepID=A0A8T2YI02_POPDE|nr:hypothetical protein H0E87_012151 [Populus deltoides]